MHTGTDAFVAPSAGSLDGDPLVTRLEQEIAQLRIGMQSRQRVGVAVGLLAGRLACTPDDAWRLLVRVSQNLNVKVRAIAELLIEHPAGPPDEPLAAAVRSQLPYAAWPEPAEGTRPTAGTLAGCRSTSGS